MRIYKLLLVFLISLALAGCSSKSWDWFFDDDEEEEVVYEEEEEEILDEEFDEEEYAEDDEYEYEYEYEEAENGDEEYADREPPRRGSERDRGMSRYGDEPEYERPEGRSREPASRTPGRTVVYFDYKKHTVPANGLNLLQLHTQFLKANPGAVVTIEGHTDSVGPAEYNKRLGLRRAEEVADLLIDMGVPASQIVTVSYGKERSAKSSSGENEQALNRRVELAY